MAERALFRRTISISAVLIGLPVWLLLSPLWVVVSLAVDAVGKLWRFPTLRLCTYFIAYLCHEWVGIVMATWLWLTGSFGRNLNLDAHRKVQAWWATSLLRWAGRLLGVQLDFDDAAEFPAENFIILSRHASMVDAIIPAAIVADKLERFVHYALKRELRWDPSLDLFGTRLRNHFVARGNDTEVEEAAIYQMAVSAEPGSALVIFPEGTYSTPETRTRVLNSLRKQGNPEVVERAEKLQALLPPKPAGTLALLRGQPEADVVVVGHVGLEGVAELRGLRRRLPLVEPVIIRWWTHARSELPTSEEELAEWLGLRWMELDRWILDNKQAGI